VGNSYKKGICEKCGIYGYVNDHHTVPKRVKQKNNKETVRLCVNCHQQLHEILPEEPQNESFYKNFTLKWIAGLLLILVIIGSILLKTNVI